MRNSSLILWAAVLVAVACPCPKAQQPPDRRTQTVEKGLLPFNPNPQGKTVTPQRTFTLAERMAGYKIPGVSVAIIHEGRIAWARGYGNPQAGKDAPVTTDTLFEAASTTKILTAVTALRFVEECRIDLDKDVNGYLKSWKIPDSDLARDHKVTLRLRGGADPA